MAASPPMISISNPQSESVAPIAATPALRTLLAAWIFLYLFRPPDQPVIIAGRTFSDREILGILVVFTVVVVFLTSVGSLLISALLVGLAVVCAHGAFRMPEDFFLDDQDSSNAGFLSFLAPYQHIEPKTLFNSAHKKVLECSVARRGGGDRKHSDA
ncbi:PRA1 family protein [Forsythia ovata]|uniref:PRA1 family protein n=1 Tax=Forsythia ovata TaxID=205694 RepID=A0ABD1X1C9_9LAMI